MGGQRKRTPRPQKVKDYQPFGRHVKLPALAQMKGTLSPKEDDVGNLALRRMKEGTSTLERTKKWDSHPLRVQREKHLSLKKMKMKTSIPWEDKWGIPQLSIGQRENPQLSGDQRGRPPALG